MQPSDQDELRRQAQKVLSRRIGVDTDGRGAPAEAPQRPRQRQQTNGQRRQARDAEQLRELTERRARERERSRPEVEPRLIETAEPTASEADAPLARTERRRFEDETGPRVHRDVHRGTHEGIHDSIHEGIHEGVRRDVHVGAYARPDLVRRRSRIYSELYDPEARRRAIVLAEILGKPVALREHEGTTTSGSY